jgi:hypothetical protein
MDVRIISTEHIYHKELNPTEADQFWNRLLLLMILARLSLQISNLLIMSKTLSRLVV